MKKMGKFPDTKQKSLEQEERVAKLFGGRRTPQSGGGKWKKGDVLTDLFLIECKTTITEKPSYTIKKEILEKANIQRKEMMKPFYAQAFTFGDDTDFFIFPKNAVEYLLALYTQVGEIAVGLQEQESKILQGERKWSQQEKEQKSALLTQMHTVIENLKNLLL
jgi:hypothetical protein